MPLRSLAFGPLPKAQVQASQRIAQAAPSSPPSLSGLGNSGQDQGYDAALTVGGPLREAEAFSPVFPDLYESNVSDLPGAQTDFNSDTAQALANPPQGTGVSFPASSGPEAWRTDLDAAFKALKGLGTTAKAVEGPQRAPGGQSVPTVDTSAFQGLLGSSGNVPVGGQPEASFNTDFLGGLEGADTVGSQIFEPELGGLGGGGGGPSVGGGIGALTSLYGLGTAAASGNPIGIAQGAINSYGALTGLAGVSPISSAIVSASPQIAAAIASSAGISTAGMSAAQLSAAVSGALAAWGGAAAPIIQGIVEYINNSEQMRMRDAGWRNNPIKGALYSNATAGVGQANKLFDSLGADLTGTNTQDLLGALIGGTNSLLPYYATAQGGRGPIRASDTVTGKNQGPTSNAQPYTGDGASPAGYTQNFTGAQDKLVAAVNELMRRGATYEELGQLPVSGNWAMESLDADNPLARLYQGNAAKYDAEAQGLLGQVPQGIPQIAAQEWQQSGEGGSMVDTGRMIADPRWSGDALQSVMNPQALFEAAQGAGAKGSDQATNASGLITSMYGGPLWTAIARMGAGGPQLQDLIQSKFDPWTNARGFTPQQLATSLDPILRRLALQPESFTSGGGTAGGGAGAAAGGGVGW